MTHHESLLMTTTTTTIMAMCPPVTDVSRALITTDDTP
jgi:hypothetical protein